MKVPQHKYTSVSSQRSPVTLLLHRPEAVWMSVVGHHHSHWVQRSPIAVKKDCFQLVICPVHVRVWVESELGDQTLASPAKTYLVSRAIISISFITMY